PHRLYVVLAARSVGEYLAQLADEDVDDFELRLVHAAVEVVEEHLLGERRALAQAQELQHLVLLAGEMHARAVHFNRLGIEIDHEIAGLDHRLGVAFGAAHDGVDTRHELVLVERLGHVVVGAEAETPDLVLDTGEAGQNQNGGLDLGDAQRPQNFEPRHVRQIQVEQDNVVIVELAEVDAFFAQIGRIDVEAFRLQHQLNRLSSGAVVLNQQHAHASPLPPALGSGRHAAAAALENALGQTDGKH